MFQFFRDDQVYWLPATESPSSFEQREHAGSEPSSNLDIVVNWVAGPKPMAFPRA
jgi:hypothetical protein